MFILKNFNNDEFYVACAGNQKISLQTGEITQIKPNSLQFANVGELSLWLKQKNKQKQNPCDIDYLQLNAFSFSDLGQVQQLTGDIVLTDTVFFTLSKYKTDGTQVVLKTWSNFDDALENIQDEAEILKVEYNINFSVVG